MSTVLLCLVVYVCVDVPVHGVPREWVDITFNWLYDSSSWLWEANRGDWGAEWQTLGLLVCVKAGHVLGDHNVRCSCIHSDP